jgi:glycosyltransferase involved in cell wall biosynthesis
MALARAGRHPLVWTPVFHPSRVHSWKGTGVVRLMELWDRLAPNVARFADGVIAATDDEGQHFQRLGAPCVQVIPPAVDKTAGRPSADARAGARAGFGLHDEPTVLLVARGIASRRKGFGFAVAAFRELRGRMPQARLLLVGSEPGDELTREIGTVAAGWCGPERVAAAYEAADVLLVSSVYEGLPRSVVEAWSHELPVAVTDRIALASLVRGQAGKVVPFGDVKGMADALEIILTNDKLAHDYGTNGRALVDGQFLLADHVDRTVALYSALDAL